MTGRRRAAPCCWTACRCPSSPAAPPAPMRPARRRPRWSRPAAPPPSEVAGGLTARAVNTTAGPRRRTRAAATVPPRLGIVRPVRREQWGADDAWLHVDDDPALELRDPPVWAPLQVITVHHTVTANGDPDPAATLRAIYDDHVHNPARDFGDIGYHVLIDEGRQRLRGPQRRGLVAAVRPTASWTAAGRWCGAAHVALNNTGNFGVAAARRPPTSTQPGPPRARRAAGRRAGPCCASCPRPRPAGHPVHYVNSAGERDISRAGDAPAVAGHRVPRGRRSHRSSVPGPPRRGPRPAARVGGPRHPPRPASPPTLAPTPHPITFARVVVPTRRASGRLRDPARKGDLPVWRLTAADGDHVCACLSGGTRRASGRLRRPTAQR